MPQSRGKLRKAQGIATSATVVSVTGQVEMSSRNYEEASGRQNPWQSTLDGVMFLDVRCAGEWRTGVFLV